MKIKIWNIRGIENKTSQQHVWYNCKKENLDIVCLLEPMVSLDVFYYSNRFGMQNVVSNCTNKVWVFHSPNIDLVVLIDHAQFMHCKFTSPSSPGPFYFTFVYAKCSRNESYPLWDGFKNISIDNSPWTIGGDFNIIAASTEKLRGNPPDQNAISDFTSCIMDCIR